MDYTYILFWNSLWTILPVIGLGIFDRFLSGFTRIVLNFIIAHACYIGSHVLMEVPELYKYGRKQTWFGTKLFIIYLFDGIVQVHPGLGFYLGLF